jgi:hypothetical protein
MDEDRHPIKLPSRREGCTLLLKHKLLGGDPEEPSNYQQTFEVTFNLDPINGHFIECFCALTHGVGSDFAATVTDACIAISRLLQRGDTFEAMAISFGEDRPEGQTNGPAASILGTIARAGRELERENSGCAS